MLEFPQMVIRLAIALALGAILGLEREVVGKEAGVRTNMLVSAGAAIFAMIALSLPYEITNSSGAATRILENNGGVLTIIANIVVGIGFLGGGIIIKTQEHVKGLTTAVTVWTAAAMGVLVAIGLIKFALTATAIIAGLLYLLRDLNIPQVKSRK